MMQRMPREKRTATRPQLTAGNRRALRWLSLAIVLTTVAAYWRVFDSDFVNFDDDHYVFKNAVIQRGLSLDFLRWAMTSTEFFNWHPLTWISLGIDYQLFGLDHPGGFHASSLAWHVVNSLVLLWLLARVTGSVARSACLAAFFALHPLHVESVAWISERKDVLSGFFWLATMMLYLAYCRRPGWLRYGATLATFALGLMAKPMLVTLPFVLLLFDYWPMKRFAIDSRSATQPDGQPATGTVSFIWLLVEKVPFLVLSVGSSFITYLAQQRGGAIKAGAEYPLVARLSSVPLNYLDYLRRTVWPANLAVIYPYAPESQPLWQVLAVTVLLLSITLVSLRFIRRSPYFFVGWFWFIGTLVPVIGMVQVGQQATADRYMYVPLIGLLLAACWGIGDLAVRLRWPRSVSILCIGWLLAACAAATWVQVGYWHDSLTLWHRAYKIAPRSPTVLSHLGNALFDRAVAVGARPLADEAERYLRMCVKIDPNAHDAQLSLGQILLQSGRKAEAIKHLRRALGDKPVLENLGILAEVEGDVKKAIGYYRQALAQNPDNAAAHQLLGEALVKHGHVEEGQRHLDDARRLKPQWRASQGTTFLQPP
jgi:protein O-mannosyl-transferase